MGNPPLLNPLPRPIGLFPAFFARQCETLVLKEKIKSLSGNSFDVRLYNGQPILKVNGESLSLSERTNVSDINGNFLFCIRKRHFTLHTTFYAENAQEEELFEVKSKFKLIGSKFIATFTSPTGEQEELVMTGDFMDTNAEVTDEASGQTVATIYRDRWNARELIADQQTYNVTVAPNVDMAIIIAMCICMDIKRDDSAGAA